MRVLCLRFPSEVALSWGELFVRYTPRVVVRPPFFIFCEISGTSELFGGEEALAHKVLELSRRLSAEPPRLAIADTAPAAQLLTAVSPLEIIAPGMEGARLYFEPLERLPELEGLFPWRDPRQLERIAEFMRLLGAETLGDLVPFDPRSLRERWGETGVTLWKRLRGKEPQVISPMEVAEPLYGYLYFEFSMTDVDRLLHEMEPVLEQLFLRLFARGRFARVLSVLLHGEYSVARTDLHVEPVKPGRDVMLFRDLLRRKLETLDLENPIKEIEIEIQDVAESVQQMDFFEPRDRREDKLERLLSFARMMDVPMGFLERQARAYPEDDYRLVAEEPRSCEPKDETQIEGDSQRQLPAAAKSLWNAPRPMLFLPQPRELSEIELRRMTLLSDRPFERILGEWWRDNRESGRDYYLARGRQGELLWVYRDRESRGFYLQGAFD